MEYSIDNWAGFAEDPHGFTASAAEEVCPQVKCQGSMILFATAHHQWVMPIAQANAVYFHKNLRSGGGTWDIIHPDHNGWLVFFQRSQAAGTGPSALSPAFRRAYSEIIVQLRHCNRLAAPVLREKWGMSFWKIPDKSLEKQREEEVNQEKRSQFTWKRDFSWSHDIKSTWTDTTGNRNTNT